MDNKEAIEVIRNNWPPNNYTMLREALEMSIKSLESAESAQTAHNMPRVEICPHCDTWTIIDNDGRVMYKIPACIRDGGQTSPVG